MGTLGLLFLAINVRDSALKPEAWGQTGTFAMQRVLSFAGDDRVYADFCQVAIWLIDWSEIERQLSKVLRPLGSDMTRHAMQATAP